MKLVRGVLLLLAAAAGAMGTLLGLRRFFAPQFHEVLDLDRGGLLVLAPLAIVGALVAWILMGMLLPKRLE